MAPHCLCWRLVGLTYLYLLIFTCPLSSCSSFLIFWYLAFLAIDWSRTVSASLPLVYISFVCPLPLLISQLSSADLALGVIPLTLTWLSFLFSGLSAHVGGWCVPLYRIFGPCSFAPPVCFGSSLGCLFPPPFSLASSGSSFPSGVVPGLSGRRLVQDFQHRPYFPPSLWFAVLFSYFPLSLSVLPYLTSVPVWYFWPQTGQGYHSAGPPNPFNPALSLAVDWFRGCCLPILFHGASY